jgi:hypothetical protein
MPFVGVGTRAELSAGVHTLPILKIEIEHVDFAAACSMH